jgi:hypothetical protein
MYDLNLLINSIETIIANHNLGKPGAYRRWNWQSTRKPGEKEDPARLTSDQRDLGVNPYGCADAANILYSIGRFPSDPDERQSWISTLQDLQNPGTGLFEEATHHPIHTTAHCIAALELFDARPRYPLLDLHSLRKPRALTAFLDGLNWRGNPWRESHRGAGLYAAMVLAGEVNDEWEQAYFAWLWEEADPVTGFWRKGQVGNVEAGETNSLFPHLAGSFHYLFNHEYAHRPLRYPAAMIDTCLEIERSGQFPLGNRISFAEIDWVYCLSRAVRQSGYRYEEVRQVLYTFAERYLAFLNTVETQTDDDFNDLHQLFGMTCCLAELQQTLPGLFRTHKPLKLVLDRRPFI